MLDKATLAKSIGAIPVFTFYELLQLGQQSGVTGTEPEVVQATLADPALMKQYLDELVFVLQTAEKTGTTTIVQVEPDSWGFMMWAMGVEGNADAASISTHRPCGSAGTPRTFASVRSRRSSRAFARSSASGT